MTLLIAHNRQAFHVFGDIFGDTIAVAEDVVSREHGIFFFEDEAHVIYGVTGGEDCADRGAAFILENMSVADGSLAGAGLVFVDPGCAGGGAVGE